MTDELITEPLYGNYRAKVVDNKDKEKFGRVMVWIPDLMPEIDDRQGLWARPANNPIGGRNKGSTNVPRKPRATRGGSIGENFEYEEELDEYEEANQQLYQGSSYIPLKNSWVWIFFEAGNINRPYYFGALDLENTPVLPENQVGSNYELKWTLLKSPAGRAIVVSDDPDDKRVEITGRKIELTDPPTGDLESVYQIDGNMTTILFDERFEKQKILIRTYKGDFLHIDIDERKLQAEFESDIVIKTNGKFYLTAKEDIHILSLEENINIMADTKDINIRAEKKNIKLAALEDTHITSVVGDIHIDATSSNVNVLSGNNMFNTVGGSFNIGVQNDHVVQSGKQMSRRAGATHDTDATTVNVQTGTSKSATPGIQAEVAIEADLAEPKGERNT